MQLSHVLDQLMTERNISAYKLSKETGISDRLIGYWRNGDKLPGAENLLIIAKYFGISVDMLLTGIDSKSQTNLTKDEQELISMYSKLTNKSQNFVLERARTLYDLEQETTNFQKSTPMIKCKHSYYKVSAGKGFSLGEGDSWEEEEIDIPDTPESRKADMCLTIMGDSMEPVYKDGDIVLVREQAAVDPGQIGIFIIEGKGYIKKYGGDKLISLNDNYDDIMFADYDADSIKCVGAVIGRV